MTERMKELVLKVGVNAAIKSLLGEKKDPIL